MSNLKKSKITVVGVFVAVMIFGGIVAIPNAHAITLAELVELLISLEIIPADKAKQARSILAEQQTPVAVCPFTWTRDLTTGSTGNDVKKLQQFLNIDPATKLITNGPGSQGEETTFFGPLTSDAVLRFQEQNRADILVLVSLLSGTGFFGPLTRAKANELCSEDGTDVQEDFNEKLREGVIKRIGQPIHGFMPSMFIEVFPGIVPKDFDGAGALLGKYKIVEKKLIFIMDEGGPIHSAAEALSKEGMKTVFSNIQRRTNVSITTADGVDSLLLFLGTPQDSAVVECLPEQRNVDVCIAIHQPVCATVNVECITTPCDPVEETFTNSCRACMNPLVSTYTKDECPVNQ